MHKDRIAEHLLGLVTDEYRAVSTVGDLMEHARDRGALWFWTNVLRTASALVWRTFMSEPGKFLKLDFADPCELVSSPIWRNSPQSWERWPFSEFCDPSPPLFHPPRTIIPRLADLLKCRLTFCPD